MKKFLTKVLIFLSVFLLQSSVTFAETLKNAGFTGDTILVSNAFPNIGENVRMSMPIYNESSGILTANVRLYQNDKKIGEKAITVKVGEFTGFTYEWKATPGTSNFVVKLEDTMIQKPKAAKEIVVLENRVASITIHPQGSVDDTSILKEYEVSSEDQASLETNGIDSFRQDFLLDAETKIMDIRKDISESVKQNTEYEKRLNELKNSLPRADGSLMTPMQYVYAWFLGAIAYILSNAYLFYGVSALLAFLVLRFIIRKLHHPKHRN